MIELLGIFWMFFQIGIFTFGGGYAMIPLIKEFVVGGNLMAEELLIDFIAISESTPGPFAVNIATFVGMEQYGVLGAVFATVGVVLPSFIIILLIAYFGKKILQTQTVQFAFRGLKPAVIGLILSVALMLATLMVFPNIAYKLREFNFSGFDYKGLIIMVIVFVLLRKAKKVSPILLILLSAVLGLLLYGVF